MAYSTTTIARTLDQINKQYFLPAIQRPYVWDPDQIVALFDSLLKGYPISSFLFWELQPDGQRDWEIYRFIDNFKQGETHNELTEATGRSMTLILDGQQRLTSLLIGLCGSYTVKKKYARRGNLDAWNRKVLYFDLMKSPTEVDPDDENTELGITYGLKFSEGSPRNTSDSHWLRVGEIMACVSDDELDRLSDRILEQLPEATTRADRRTVERNLERLYRIVHKDEVVAYYTEKDQSLDRVLDIFVRANDGGTKLSKSDLLLSMVTSKWKEVSARQAIFDLVDQLNSRLDAPNDFSKDFVMKACLVLSELDVTYNVNNFTNENLFKIEGNWDKIKVALCRAVSLINSFGINKNNLTSANAVLPLAYYLSQIDSDLQSLTEHDKRNSARIHKFMLGALLNAVFGGNSDQAISTSRGIIRNALRTSQEFPLDELIEGLARRGRVAALDEKSLEGLFDDIRYGRKQCFLTLSLLYDTQNWGTTSYHVDHIIPQSQAKRSYLQAQNVPEARIEKILKSMDRLGNLQLLRGQENLEKNDTPFSHWVETRDLAFQERHLIPPNRSLWTVQKLPEFVEERERMMIQKITAGYRLNMLADRSDLLGSRLHG